MTHIFVSHSSKDDDTVTRIHDALEATTGREVWVDHQDIPPGADWQTAIDTSLRDCESLLLVLSRHSAASKEVTAEWRDALLRGKTVYVAIIDDLPIEDMSSRLRLIQSVNLHADWDKGLEAVIATIKGEALADDAPVTPPRPVSGNIDARLTTIPISGRDSDIAEITRHLDTGRPTLILGVGGLGKSRLAAEMVLNYPGVDGAIWHRCSEISRVDELLVLLRQHFGLDPATEREDVLAQFRQHKRLVVFDNAESVPEGDERRTNYARLINDLAQHDACVLLTSRVEWNEIDEPRYTYRPQRLEPAAAADVVRDMAATFGVADAVTDHAAEFAEAALYHAGLMDWSVRQLRRFPLTKVLNDLHALPNREPSRAEEVLEEFIHRTLRQMVETTGPAAEQVLRRLAVCRGGYTYDAAQAIGSLPEREVDVDDALETLQTWQFIRFENQRYFTDPLVEAILQPDDNAYRPHYDYYYELARKHDEAQDYLGLDIESDNLEVAFEWAIEASHVVAALALAVACGHFIYNRGRFDLRLNWFRRVAQALEFYHDDQLGIHAQTSLGVIYHEHPFGSKLDNLNRAIATYKDGLQFYASQAAWGNYAITQNNLGGAYGILAAIKDRKENLEWAIAAFKESLLYQKAEDVPLDYATTFNNLGEAYRMLSSLEDRADNLQLAIAAFEESLKYRTPQAAPLDYASTQRSQGNTYEECSDLLTAIKCWREAERYYRQMDHVTEADRMLEWIAKAEAKLAAGDDTDSPSDDPTTPDDEE